MWIAPVDATFGPGEWRPFVESQGLGHFVAAGRGRDVPVIVPTQFVLDSDEVLVHFVARNPVFEALAENESAVLSVAGDWAFVPSAFKALGEEDPRLGIPTTYYGAVQIEGRATVVEDPAGVAEILRRQLSALQPGVEVADPLEAHSAKLRAIAGVRLAVGTVRAKFKYGGNVDEAHRRAVVERLRARGGPGDDVAAEHALRRLAGPAGAALDAEA
ncbi:MAG: FMN-binding negative transcriptional regulator [Acidimicrobiales bacterium]